MRLSPTTTYTKNCTVNVGVIYRHPSLTNINKFLEDFSTCLCHFSTNNKTAYLLRDLNINLDKFNRSKIANNYINIIISNSAIPIITLSARVTSATSTIFDHIITDDLKHKIVPFVICSDRTDHYFTVCSVASHSKVATSGRLIGSIGP